MKYTIKNLVDARRLFNDLSDKIYAVAEGDLDNSKYFSIYQNFEDFVRERLIAIGGNKKSLDECFSTIILNAAQNEATLIKEASGKDYYITTIAEIYSLITSRVAFEIIEE